MEFGTLRGLFWTLLLSFACSTAWAVAYVNADATGANDGSSWTDAYTDLQTALATTVDDDIWVAAGTYYPDAGGDVNATFQLKNKVHLYGGFAGTETSRNQRHWNANVTILSGDIDLDGTPAGNSRHVVTASNTNASAVLDGFTVTMGNTGSDTNINGYGAAMVVVDGSPTIRHVVFLKNKSYACGVYLENASPRIEFTKFIRNFASFRGAGLCSYSALTLTDVVFSSNTVKMASTTAWGAGLYYYGKGTLSITRGRFINNRVLQAGTTGDYYTVGGGAYIGSGDFVIRDSVFQGNRANNGAGLRADTAGQIINTVFVDNNTYSTPTPSGGTLIGAGAAIMALGLDPSSIVIINSVVANNNSANSAGGIYTGYGSHAEIRNSIFWNNTSLSSGLLAQVVGSYTIDHSIVEGLVPGPDYPGSSGDDPQFADLAGNDFHLQSTSPAIDAGDNTLLPKSVTQDLDRSKRRADDPTVPDSGSGRAPIVDMGAYEYGALKPHAYVNLMVSTADDPDPALAKLPLTYNLYVTNIGTRRAGNVQFVDTLPNGTQLLSVAASTGRCKGENPVTCMLGSLPATATASVQLTVVPKVTGTVVNEATVSTTSRDRNTGNNTDSENTTVEQATLHCNTGSGNLTVTTLGHLYAPLSGVIVRIRGPGNCTRSGKTDANGKLTFSLLPYGSYTILPTLSGCSFDQPFITQRVATNTQIQFSAPAGCH